MIKSLTLYKVILIFLAIIIGGVVINKVTDNSNATTTIYPVEGLGIDYYGDHGLLQRQRVDLYLHDSDSIETIIISTADSPNDYFSGYEWAAIEDENYPAIHKLMDPELYISYQGKTIFSTHDLIYDYIRFNTVCTNSGNRQQLLFSMVRGGSANGELQDMLFIYIDPVTNSFQHKVIERRYLPDICDMENAEANKSEQEQQLSDINTIHAQLRPSIEDTYPDEYVASGKALPTRQFSHAQFEAILMKFKQFMPIEIQVENEVSTNGDGSGYEYTDFYEPEFIIEDIAENSNWRIIEVLYLQLYTSWGVFIAENKNTGQWTAFYTVFGGGDSKNHLYFNDEVELVDNELRGSFTLYGDQTLAISLNDFTVQSVSK